MNRFRTNGYYSIGLAIAWAVVLTLVRTIRGPAGVQPFLLIFADYCIGWVWTTIAHRVVTDRRGPRAPIRRGAFLATSP